jgi:hypothetical protein
VGLARQRDVSGEPARPQQQRQILYPPQRFADHWRITRAAAHTALVMFW